LSPVASAPWRWSSQWGISGAGRARAVSGGFYRTLASLGGVGNMGKKVGTHNGSFHCDEALGCFMIRLTNKFADAEIVRTRDQKVRNGAVDLRCRC
jgi:hypothetical protein